MGYTLRQFRGYLELSYARERRQRRQLMEACALGFSGGEGLLSALKQLQD